MKVYMQCGSAVFGTSKASYQQDFVCGRPNTVSQVVTAKCTSTCTPLRHPDSLPISLGIQCEIRNRPSVARANSLSCSPRADLISRGILYGSPARKHPTPGSCECAAAPTGSRNRRQWPKLDSVSGTSHHGSCEAENKSSQT